MGELACATLGLRRFFCVQSGYWLYSANRPACYRLLSDAYCQLAANFASLHRHCPPRGTTALLDTVTQVAVQALNLESGPAGRRPCRLYIDDLARTMTTATTLP